MNIYLYIEEIILKAIGKKVPGITVEPTRNSKYGDIATNAPIILSNIEGKSREEVAAQISSYLEKSPEVQKVELASAGFLNITMHNKVWHDTISMINDQGIAYGNLDLGQGKTTHVESVSANPTGPLHIGHARSAVFFEALSKVLEKAGYNIVREYYINDAGAQVDSLVESTFLRYKEALGEPFPASATYPGKYLKVIGEKLLEQHGNSLQLNSDKNLIRDFTISEIMCSIKQDLLLLNIKHDIFVSEASVYDEIQEAVDTLQKKDLVYIGTLDDPKGKKSDAWQAHDHLLFRATAFGDESDRSLKKADGSWTYFAADIAYHLDKIKRGFKNMILGLGIDHAGYVKRMEGAIAALGEGDINIDIKLYNIVRLFKDGVAVKMSKRSGNFVTVRDLIEDVGSDVVKYMMLTRRHDVVLDIDLELVKEQSKNNPVFYVQYAHARACSVLRQVGDNIGEVDLSLLITEAELSLVKILAKWPRVVQSAARTYEPHRITIYLQEISEAFHALWHYGNKDKFLRFIVSDDRKLTAARAALLTAVKNTIASALNVLNIKAQEKM